MFGIRAKLLVFAALVWLVIFGLYGAYVYEEKIDSMERGGITSARVLSEQILAEREFYASNVVERVLAAGLNVSNGGRERVDLIPPHATLVRKAEAGATEEGDFFVDVISSDPINASKMPRDSFQLAGLNALSSGKQRSFYAFEEHMGRYSIRYLVPNFATTSSCVECHNTHPRSKKSDYRLGDVMGAVEVIIPIDAERHAVISDIQRSIGYGFVVILVMGMAGLAFLSRLVTKPLQKVAETTKQLSTGDLTGKAPVESSDEIGSLAEDTNDVVRNLHGMIEDIRSTSNEAVEIAANVRETSQQVVEGSHIQASSLDSITSSMEKITASVSDIVRGTDVLAASTEKGSVSVYALGGSINETASNMETLVSNVDYVATSTIRISASIKEVSKNIADLCDALGDVSTSIIDINEKIEEVDAKSSESAGLAEELIEDARGGMSSVERTIEGIDMTREMTSKGVDAIKVLSERLSEIGKIVDVIRSVSEETNILALNAAIIATKAGESGRSFSVVAGEITELADRTSTSTKEMAKLIKGVETESLRAVDMMTRGFLSAEEDKALGEKADSALEKIVESAERSNERISDIAAAAAYQSNASRKVVEATGKVARTTERIVSAAEELASESELISRAASRINDVSLRVKGTTVEQVDANRKITSSMEEVTHMVTRINTALKEQSQGAARILHSIEDVREVSLKNIAKARESEGAVEALAKLNKTLTESVRRFKLKGPGA